MAVAIAKLKGMPFELRAKLKRQGIYNSDQLLEATLTPVARRALAERVGVDLQVMWKLAARSDLARVPGIGGVFSALLQSAGVTTVDQLARCHPNDLYAKLWELNPRGDLAGRMPTRRAVEDWVFHALALPKILQP